MKPGIYSDTRCILGEGPVWDHTKQALWWLDIKAKELHCKGTTEQSWILPHMVSALACTNNEQLIFAAEDGLYSFNPTQETHNLLTNIETELPDNRCNDGKTDRQGRFWFGTMDNLERDISGGLYWYNGKETRKVLSDIQISNTLCWSPDNKTMYFADSAKQTIWAFDFNIAAGSLSNQRVFVSLQGTNFYPDGSAIDSDGCVWNAQWDGSRVVRYTPNGKQDQVIELPTSRPTSCMFGGSDLQTLFITTASIGLAPDEELNSGKTFCVQTKTAGLPQTSFQM
jgi:L-arabinonolactonase